MVRRDIERQSLFLSEGLKGREEEKFNSAFIYYSVCALSCERRAIIPILKGFSVFWKEEDTMPPIQQKNRGIQSEAEYSVIQYEAVQFRSTN